MGRLSTYTHDLAGTSGDVTTGFSYNPANQVTARTRSNIGYVYGGEVNVARTYSVNGLNQYLTAGTASFTYDPRGNLTSDGSTSYTYDVHNRLIAASGARTANLSYDPLGRLYETSGGPLVASPGASASAAGITRFLYDGDELVAEYSATGTLLRRYVHGAGVDDPIIWYEGSTVTATSRRHLFADHQGSIVGITNGCGQRWWGGARLVGSQI